MSSRAGLRRSAPWAEGTGPVHRAGTSFNDAATDRQGLLGSHPFVRRTSRSTRGSCFRSGGSSTVAAIPRAASRAGWRAPGSSPDQVRGRPYHPVEGTPCGARSSMQTDESCCLDLGRARRGAHPARQARMTERMMGVDMSADGRRRCRTNIAPGSLCVWLTTGGSTAEAREDTPDRGAEGHLRGMANGAPWRPT